MSIELHIHFTFLCLCAWVFYSGFISLFFMIQALKNIAAISLAINYPNKSTQLLNMSPWEQLTGRGNSLQELGGACPDSAGSFSQCRWVGTPRTPIALTSHESYCATMDRELKKHLLLTQSFLPYWWIQCIVYRIHLNWTVLKSFRFL